MCCVGPSQGCSCARCVSELRRNGTRRSRPHPEQRNRANPTGQEPAAQEAAELLPDEPRQAVARVDAGGLERNVSK
jgi:hypothetical protein